MREYPSHTWLVPIGQFGTWVLWECLVIKYPRDLGGGPGGAGTPGGPGEPRK